MRSQNILSGLVLGLCLLCVPTLSPAADAPAKPVPAVKADVPAAKAPAAKADIPQAAEQTTLTILPPTEEIVVSFPLMLVERGTVENVDAKTGTFELKRKDGTLARIKVDDKYDHGKRVCRRLYLGIQEGHRRPEEGRPRARPGMARP